MDFTLRKDATTQPPHYIVIFKAKDAGNMEQAFKEFTAKKLQREERPSIRKNIAASKERQRPATLTGPRKIQRKGAVTMKPEMKKLIIANLPYLLFVYLFGKLGQAYRLAEGIDLSQSSCTLRMAARRPLKVPPQLPPL